MILKIGLILGLHSILAVCVCSGVLDVDLELLALLLGSQLPFAAQLLHKDSVLLLKTWAFWPAVILCYVMRYGDSTAEEIIGVIAVHAAGGCAVLTSSHRDLWDRELLNLCAAWLVTTVTVLLVSELLRSHLECQKELENQRDYNQILLQAYQPFSQLATCCLRGCPSLFNVTSDSELQMKLMSANNPVVVRSSAEFDALFGRQMMGLSLDKAWVAHHLGRQQLKGIFCQDKPKEELNITFVDADGNLFECRVLFPKEVESISEAPAPAQAPRASRARELVVGFCLVGAKRRPLERDLTATKSKSLPERKAPLRGSIVRLSKLPRSPRSKVSSSSQQPAPGSSK